MEKFGKFVAFILMLVYITLLNGWVFWLLYNWILVEIFQLSSLGFIQAVGINFIIEYIKPISQQNLKEKKLEDFFLMIIESTIAKVATLGIGWIIAQFI